MQVRGQSPQVVELMTEQAATRESVSQERLAARGRLRFREGPLPELLSETQWRVLGGFFNLSRRQAQMARLIFAGHSQQSIADHCSLSINTVRMHIRGLFKKVGVRDRVAMLVRMLAAARRLTGEETLRALRSGETPVHVTARSGEP